MLVIAFISRLLRISLQVFDGWRRLVRRHAARHEAPESERWGGRQLAAVQKRASVLERGEVGEAQAVWWCAYRASSRSSTVSGWIESGMRRSAAHSGRCPRSQSAAAQASLQ